MASSSSSYLPYEEPGITTLLIQASFLFLLNAVNHVLDRLIYCGLLGQVFLGVAWGTPGAKWLQKAAEEAFVQLGYLGLILLVYEGGLSTNFRALKANLGLSIGVAVTGISLPIALSFALQRLAMATPLQSFAAGAALCSTSLGTTFTVLDTSGLTTTRLGVILTSAAMMDDVVGLIMVQVISNLGSSESSFSAITVVRPVIVSIALVIILVLSCRFIVKPATIVLNNWCESAAPDSAMRRVFQYKSTALVVHSAILFGLVTGASYAGTSNLYAAYLAGASISWRDTEIPRSSTKVEVTPTPTPSGESSEPSEKFQTHEQPPRNVDSIAELQTIESPQTNQTNKETSRSKATKHEQPRNVENPSPRNPPHWTGSTIYKDYYLAPVQRILKPLFFASIGLAIPITEMFSGPILWRGIVYAVLMTLAKMTCGIWLVRFDLHKDRSTTTTTEPTEQKPLSLYPSSILGLAMVSRGEIGFLISSVAESGDIFSSASSSSTSPSSSEIYLIVTWAILLCTVIGPLGVGTLVRRVKRLQIGLERGGGNGAGDPLGDWGVI